MKLDISQKLFAKAKQLMPGGVNSPVRAFQNVAGIPRFIQSARGAYLIDVDGNQYVDYVGSWGPMILGHAHPLVLAAVQQAAENGLSFGAPCEAEIRLAEKIIQLMPNIEKIRMVNSGTEASMSAIRLARAVTGRDKFIKFEGCYHGHADSLLVKAGSGALTFGHPSSPGVPDDITKNTLVADFNDFESVEKLFSANLKHIAAVIIEPIAGNMNCIPADPVFLKSLRELCDQHQALLIFDEVMTGFRVAKGGAQAIYQIKPDLTCLGKVIGSGMPVGAFGGRASIMDQLAPLGAVYQAGTLSGNPLAMTAGLVTLNAIDQPNFFENLSRMTQNLLTAMQNIAEEQQLPFTWHQQGGMFGFLFSRVNKITRYQQVIACDQTLFKRFFNLMLAENIYLAPSMFEAGFVSSAHSSIEIDKTLNAFEKVLKILKSE